MIHMYSVKLILALLQYHSTVIVCVCVCGGGGGGCTVFCWFSSIKAHTTSVHCSKCVVYVYSFVLLYMSVLLQWYCLYLVYYGMGSILYVINFIRIQLYIYI